jgi:transcriptional regulator with XRE-family HTH domain
LYTCIDYLVCHGRIITLIKQKPNNENHGELLDFFIYNTMTFKELRLNAKMNQLQMADLLKVNQSVISCYDNGTSLPDLEHILLIQEHFNVDRITFKENLTPLRKHQVVQSVINLTEKLPLAMVFEFAARQYRRSPNPAEVIINTANTICGEIEEPLLPAAIEKLK